MKRTREEQINHLRTIRDFSFDDSKRFAALILLNKLRRDPLDEVDHDEIAYFTNVLRDYIKLDIDVVFSPQTNLSLII